MTKFTHKALVVPINREPHPNADSLSVVRVNESLTVVIRTEDWVGQEKAVYIPPQNIVDTSREEFAWLSHLCKNGQTRVRIKPVKLRGVYSHGIFVKCPEWANIGDDLTDHFKIEHWEPETETSNGSVNGGIHNSISKYDIDSVHKFKLDSTIDIICLEKIHGANMRVYMDDDGVVHVGSRSQWKAEGNEFWRAYHNSNVDDCIFNFLRAYPNHILYGEMYGMVKGYNYGLDQFSKPKMIAFDIRRPDGSFFDYLEFTDICFQYGIDQVPVVHQGKNIFDELEPFSHGKTLLGRENNVQCDHIREGIVVRPLVEMQTPKFERLIYKIINPEYK